MMLLSKFLLPVLKDDPRDAVVTSHKLMLRTGMIRQVGAGLYNWLPLGRKVLRKVEEIVRREMDAAGALEVLMPSMQPIELWERSGRYGAEGDLSSEMLIIKDRSGNALTFAPTAEEVVVDLFARSVQSYKELPKNLYQISWKFRDEIRPRFGLMRAREFLMKDAYSFDASEVTALASYEIMFGAYVRIFKNLGLQAIAVKADTGSMGGDLSHEFHVLANSGESTIYYDRNLENYLAQGSFSIKKFNEFYAKEEQQHALQQCDVPQEQLAVRKGIEVGHIFYLGDKYTKALGAAVQGSDGSMFHPFMGCYGIGVSRVVAAIIEANSDESGIIWPEAVAPFDVIINNLRVGDAQCDAMAASVTQQLENMGKTVLVDDTSSSMGEKVARAKLLGMPWIINIGPRSVAAGKLEVIRRRDLSMSELQLADALKILA
jgi:prolyl-tRNA synthetase